jgi:hypothetical protein
MAYRKKDEAEEQIERKYFSPYADEEHTCPEWFPDLGNISAGFFYRMMPVPDEPTPPEYVYVRSPEQRIGRHRTELRYELAIAEWNSTWDAGEHCWQLHDGRRSRRREGFPRELRWLFKARKNIRLVPRNSRHSYNAYAPLYHLLPRGVLERFGLPLLKRGLWPYTMMVGRQRKFDAALGSDFDGRLAKAFSYYIWPFIAPGKPPSGYDRDEPLIMLSHNLDFWLPYVDLVAQRRLRAGGRGKPESDETKRLIDKINAEHQGAGASVQVPCTGGHIWLGEDEAREATAELIEIADAHGKLRSIIEAVRSNRVEEDFSSKWSPEREDFERRLHAKRHKVRPVFVEIDDAVPVHGPRSELDADTVWADLLAMASKKERRVIVCLRSGVTGVGDIADELGYANHSPVSKALQRIRRIAAEYFDLNN